MRERKLGYFVVAEHVHDMPSFAHLLAHILFTPMQVDFLAYNGEFQMIGKSPKFRTVPLGAGIPQYRLVMHTGPGGDHTYEVAEVEKSDALRGPVIGDRVSIR